MPPEEQLSVKEFLGKIRSWFKYLLSKWLLIGAVAAVGAGLGIWYAYSSKPTYEASITFVLSTGNSSGNNLMGLASQFGISFGGGNDDLFSGDNIIALMKSKKMVQETLLRKPEGSGPSLLNILVKELKLDMKWENRERTKGSFPFPDDTSKMTLIQDSLFRELYMRINEKMLDVSKPDKDQSIYAVTTASRNEIFSYYFSKYLVASTSAFYIGTKTKTAKQNLNMLQNEADSLRYILGGAITSAGTLTDKTFNLNPAYQAQRSGAQQSQVRASALGEAYGEVLKNLEIAKITLLKETPLYQVIDEPNLPLLQKKLGRLIGLIIGGFISTFLVLFFLVVKKVLGSIE